MAYDIHFHFGIFLEAREDPPKKYFWRQQQDHKSGCGEKLQKPKITNSWFYQCHPYLHYTLSWQTLSTDGALSWSILRHAWWATQQIWHKPRHHCHCHCSPWPEKLPAPQQLIIYCVGYCWEVSQGTQKSRSKILIKRGFVECKKKYFWVEAHFNRSKIDYTPMTSFWDQPLRS